MYAEGMLCSCRPGMQAKQVGGHHSFTSSHRSLRAKGHIRAPTSSRASLAVAQDGTSPQEVLRDA